MTLKQDSKTLTNMPWRRVCGTIHMLLQTILNTLVLVYSATLITQSGFQIDVSILAFLLAEKATAGRLNLFGN